MARRRFSGTRISVGTSWEDPESGNEIDIEVECDVTPGEPEVRYQRNGDPGWPGCGPEVEIVSALDASGKDWTGEITADRDWLARVEEKAVEEFADAVIADREGAAEARADAIREARMLGE